MRNQPTQQGEKTPRLPTHVVRTSGRVEGRPLWEQIGVAWEGDNGSFFVRLHGTQIVTEGFHLFPKDDAK